MEFCVVILCPEFFNFIGHTGLDYITGMEDLKTLPNIGRELADKLSLVGIDSAIKLREAGSENAFIKLKTIDPEGSCINMLYALEGAIQGIRWHGLSPERKQELKEFYRMINRK